MSGDADIDIEEHDLLLHPALRSVFPDLSLVKQECVSDEGDNVEEDPPDEYRSKPPEPRRQSDATLRAREPLSKDKPDSTTDLPPAAAEHVEPPGSPTASPLVTSSQSLAPSREHSPPAGVQRPGRSSLDTEQHEDRCFRAALVLEDWGSYLSSSKCYCGQCRILFATENALAGHNMSDHSHLTVAALSSGSDKENATFSCDRCPAKFSRFYNLKKHKVSIHMETLGETVFPHRASAKKSTTQQRSAAHLCQVCDTSLPSKEDLIAHLYDHVGHQCKFCNALFSQKALLEKHLWTHARSVHSSGVAAASANKATHKSKGGSTNRIILGSKPNLPHGIAHLKGNKGSTKKLKNYEISKTHGNEVFVCPICSYCCFTDKTYMKHMLVRHDQRVSSIPDACRRPETVKRCEACSKDFTLVCNYNKHLLQFHGDEPVRPRPAPAGTGLRRAQPAGGVAAGNKVKKVTAKPNKLATSPETASSNMKVKFKFKCRACGQSFPSYKSGLRHRHAQHADRAERGLIVRDVHKIILKRSVELKRQVGLVNSRRTMINAVVQCDRCQVCFFSKEQTYIHVKSEKCQETNLAKCKLCGLTFYASMISQHYLLHELGSREFQLLSFRDLSGDSCKVLFKCVDCEVHFHSENSVARHLRPSRGAPQTSACGVCGLTLLSNAMQYHQLLHSRRVHMGRLSVAHFTHDINKLLAASKHLPPKLPSAKKAPPIPKIVSLGSATSTAIVKKESASPQSNTNKAEISKNTIKKGKKTFIKCKYCKNMIVRNLHSTLNGKCKSLKYIICLLCGLSFTKRTALPHAELHRASATPLTLRDFVIKSSTDGRVLRMSVKIAMKRLFECRCGARATRRLDLCKQRNECGVNSVECSICEMTFVKSAYAWHMDLHKKCGDIPAPDSRPDRVSGLDASPTTFARCEDCKRHLTFKSIDMHKKYCGFKRLGDPDYAYVCPLCGLMVGSSIHYYHQTMHANSKKSIGYRDLTIVNMSDRQPVAKEHCRFPKCKNCKVNILGKHDDHNKRNCALDPGKTCRTCGMCFSRSAFDLHLPYFDCDSRPVERSKPQPKKTLPKVKIKQEEVSQLMSNYSKLENVWTQLYQCEECVVIVDSYDEVVKHCEQHQAPAYEIAAFVCHVCDLNFDFGSFQRHKDQHFTRPGLNRERFEVAKFKPSDYNTPTWTVYRNAFTGGSVGYELVQAGPEQNTLYRCTQCHKFVDSRVAVYLHATQNNFCPGVAKRCSACRYLINWKCSQSHRAHHQQHPDLVKSSFRIFSFSANIDLRPQTASATNSKILLHKCSKCDIHFLRKRYMMRHCKLHDTTAEFEQRRCARCGYTFTRRTLRKHLRDHHGRSKAARGDFQVILYGERVAAPAKENKNKIIVGSAAKREPPPTLHRCAACDVHFLTGESLRAHIEYRRCRTTARGVCAQCNMGFEKTSLSQHASLHHTNAGYTALDFIIDEMAPKVLKRKHKETAVDRKIVLFRCSGCGTTFLTRGGLMNHFRTEDFNFAFCKVCNMKYGRLSMHRHTQLLHKNGKMIANCEVVERRPPTDACLAGELTIFKCSDCDHCFLNISQAKLHTRAAAHVPTDRAELVACACGLHFSRRSYIKHRRCHHSAEDAKYTVVLMHPKQSSEGIQMDTRADRSAHSNTPENSSPRKRRGSPLPDAPPPPPPPPPPRNHVIYKCTGCSAHFVSKKTADTHVQKGHVPLRERDLYRCERCKLHFTKYIIKRHGALHHAEGAEHTFTIEDVTPQVTSPAGGSDTMKEDAYENVEYLDEVDTETDSSDAPKKAKLAAAVSPAAASSAAASPAAASPSPAAASPAAASPAAASPAAASPAAASPAAASPAAASPADASPAAASPAAASPADASPADASPAGGGSAAAVAVSAEANAVSVVEATSFQCFQCNKTFNSQLQRNLHCALESCVASLDDRAAGVRSSDD